MRDKTSHSKPSRSLPPPLTAGAVRVGVCYRQRRKQHRALVRVIALEQGRVYTQTLRVGRREPKRAAFGSCALESFVVRYEPLPDWTPLPAP